MAFFLTGELGRAESRGYSLISTYSGTETGLYTTLWDVAQDKDGVLYFAGTSLLTFDGDHWRKSAIGNAYAIRNLNFAPDGRLWAAMIGDLGWFESSHGKWVFHSLLSRLPASERNIGDVWNCIADAQGATFVTDDRVLRWNGQHMATWPMPGEKRLFPSRSNGTLWVHHYETGLYELGTTGPRLVISREILGSAMVLWTERRGADLLVATSNGLSLYTNGRLTTFAPEVEPFTSEGRLVCACRLPDGRIALGTFKRGIAFVLPDGTLESVLGPDEGIPSPVITSLFVSADGELWATTGTHILRIGVGTRSTIFDSRAGLPRQIYRRVAKVRETLFVANESGVYALPEHANRFFAIESLPGRAQQLLQTGRGLLVNGYRGSYAWNGGRAEKIYSTNFDVFAAVPRFGNSEELLLADNRTIGRLSPAGDWHPLVRQLASFPTSLAEDRDGRIWIGTLAGGVLMATPSSETAEARTTNNHFGLPTLEGPSEVRTNRAGTVMVFANNGAWKKAVSADTFVPIARFPVRNLAAVSEMEEDDTVWVAHENTETKAPCIGRVSAKNGVSQWEPHTVEGLLEVGSPRSICADVSATGETTLWIGGTQALLRHEVGNGLSIVTPRPPLLRAFVRGSTDADREPIRGSLPYATDQVEFEFAAPEHSRRSLLRIETRIDGIDRDWIPLLADSRRELTAVRDGHYTVRARVVAETGATSPETVFSFDVLPPFWRTTPFAVAVAVLLLPLGYGVYVLRVRTLRRRNVELEQKVRERTEELVAANAAKTQFVANMSHDIRNPLNGIVGLAIALEDTRLAPRQREIVATLRECTTYLSSLVDDVLDFASIEAGRVELRPRAYAPTELLASIVETLKVDATSSGATLSVVADPNLPGSLVGDAGRIQQILVNFVSNALKYAGGHIELSVHAPTNAPGEIEFAVKDHGPGISEEEQSRLFTKFSRLRQKQGGEEIPGTGLGLASCRLLADIMGGSVGLESQPGAGARFSLRLPMTVATEPITAVTADLPNTAVLLVEDTDYNAWAATAVLSRLGLTCERARTGAEALELFGRKRFNVVLLDRNLPDMDGTEVARRMREMESDGLQAVLLAVTAYCTAEDRELCLRAGMDAFVGKPLTPEKLRNILIAASRRLLAAASVQAVPEATAVEVDTSLLAYLSDGSAEGLQLQIDRFIATLDEFEAELLTAVAAKDLERVRTSAHRLLGQAKMVGGTALATATQDLEQAARAGDGVACESLLPRVHVEAQSLKEAMRHRRSAAPSA